MTTLKNKYTYSRQKARRLVKSIDKYSNLPRSQVVHHIDGNPLNNELSNLVILSNSEHIKLHWVLNPEMGKSKSNKQREKELEELLIRYNFNK